MTTPPPLAKVDYFCDHTIYRFYEQMIRAFSDFKYPSNTGSNPVLNEVPCVSGQSDPNVAALLNKSSDTTIPTVPIIAVSLTNVAFRHDAVQCPTFESYAQTVERELVGGAYTQNRGRAYLVQRLMPRPFTLTFDVDVWTSNRLQKLTLLEQMCLRFAPSFQIQISENPLEWSARTEVFLEDIVLSSVPGAVGTDTNRVDYFTMRFSAPMWLSPPAKVKELRRIEEVVTNVTQVTDISQGTQGGTPFEQVIVTPEDYCIAVENNTIILLSSKTAINDDNGNPFDFADLITQYGSLRPGQTTVRLSTTSNIEDTSSDIVGTVAYSPNGVNQLVFTPDPATLPADTLAPVTAVVDPRTVFPGNVLANATIGQRYIFAKSITGPNEAWGTLSAERNDIVEYDGTHWSVVYRPVPGAGAVADRVTNLASNRQLTWTPEGWAFTYDKVYHPGYWRLFI